MRLWHYDLIPQLSRARLLGQHRECCALRGGGWKRRHATVDYVFLYSPLMLYEYHRLVMVEMKKRNYRPDICWQDVTYRGKKTEKWSAESLQQGKITADLMYKEHDRDYLLFCLEKLNDGK